MSLAGAVVSLCRPLCWHGAVEAICCSLLDTGEVDSHRQAPNQRVLLLLVGGQVRPRCANRLSDSIRQDLQGMGEDMVAAWSVWLVFSMEWERDRMLVYSHCNQ